ncbi:MULTISPECIES: hypothetical protein [Paraburkholderia]|uniref:hypothetical protein n=1 Tax=Paraburkholderia TaxID=1822464 RepID=UPI0013A6BE49|nr:MULTISPECIES: hypothetical protein [Paraburkholderia]MDH6148178.1 hypothetical protein [Paraburkholderia sp. WSM4179]
MALHASRRFRVLSDGEPQCRLRSEVAGVGSIGTLCRAGFLFIGVSGVLRLLAEYPQLMLLTGESAALAARLHISDTLQIANELEMLRYALTEGYGRAFLPTRSRAHDGRMSSWSRPKSAIAA